MSMMLDLDVEIVSSARSINYLNQIKNLSDRNKSYLGVIPQNVLEHSYHRNEILIATVNDQFAGYLLYRIIPKYRRYNIAYVCIEEHFRGEGIPNLLIDSLKNICIGSNYNGISLYCRHGYTYASKVWKNNLFYPVNEKASRGLGETVSLTNWWWANNMCRDLFASDHRTYGVNMVLDLGILTNLKSSDSVALHLMADSLVGEIDFFVSRESIGKINELEDQVIRREVQSCVRDFHRLEFHSKTFKKYERELNNLFSDVDIEMSDIKQLAQTLASGKKIFITDSEELLAEAQKLYEKYEANIFQPHQVWEYLDQCVSLDEYQPVRLSEASLQLRRVELHEVQSICTLFLHTDEDKDVLFTALNSLVSDVDSSEVLLVSKGKSTLAIIAISDIDQNESVINIFRVLDSEVALTLSYQLLNFALKRQARLKISKLCIADEYSSLTEEVTQVFGFKRINNTLLKLLKFGEVSVANLPSYLNQDISLSSPPNFKLNSFLEAEALEEGKGRALSIEKALWPLKISDIDIPIYVVPIKAYWAMQLFDEEIASEDIFGPDPGLVYNFENVYYSAQKMNIESPGRIAWYVSETHSKSPLSGHIRAISYLDKAEVGLPESLFNKYKRLGIYAWEDVFKIANFQLNKEISAITFSRTELLSSPMTLNELSLIREKLGQGSLNLLSPLEVDIDIFKAITKKV